MTIGQAAQKSGVNAKLIRHYESIGVTPRVSRTESGYRTYSDDDVQILRFVRRARSLGFDMKDIKKLVGLWRNKSRSSADVKNLCKAHIANLEKKMLELQTMTESLRHLSKNCHGDNRPHCPILNNFSGDEK